MPPMTDASPLRDVDDVGGVWLMQGTGMLLAIEARDPTNVTYRLDDKGALARDPIDLGTVSLDDRGNLTLASDKAPAGCAAVGGPRITMADVVVTELGFEARRGVEAVCVDAALTNSWLRVAAR